jgi:hypothetical protein
LSLILGRFFASGHAADLVLAVIALEFAVLVWRRRRPLSEVILTLGPGACLLLALRCALTGAPWPWIALWLAASFPLHLADVIRRKL